MSSPSTSSFLLSVTLILIGCCLNVVDLEFITKADPGAGVLVTCAQFVFIASEGFLQHYRPPFGLLPRIVPFSIYVKLTAVFFLMSVMNNQALAFSISMPVHTVFRSSSLAASLFLGIVWYGKKYPRTQILSCLLVTLGIMIITLADATLPKECCGGSSSHIKIGNETKVGNETNIKFFHIIIPMTESTRWLIGIMMLTLALLMSAWMGHEQDRVFTTYGKCWKEMLFYIHLCSLPGFVLTWENIRQHIITWMTAPPVTLITLSHWGPITISLPWLLVGNLMTQYVCVRGVYKLTSISGALTTTLIITFRKFISLIISIVYFHNPFTIYHWFGTLLVFIGLCAYSYPSSQPTSHKINSDAITRDSTNIISTPSPTPTPNSKDDISDTSDDTNDVTSTELTPLTHRYPTRGRSRSNSDLGVPTKRITRSTSRTRHDDDIPSTTIHITPKRLVNGVHI